MNPLDMSSLQTIRQLRVFQECAVKNLCPFGTKRASEFIGSVRPSGALEEGACASTATNDEADGNRAEAKS